MRFLIRLTLVIAGLTLVYALQLQAERAIRRAPIGDRAQPVVKPLGADEDSLLFYHFQDSLVQFWTIPNDYGDLYYCVRFTPPRNERFTLLEARIPLFDVFGDMGTPGLRVIVWQSQIIDERSIPGEAIDSVDVPFDSLVFSSGGGQEAIDNIIDLRELGISFNGPIDFFVGVDGIIDNRLDTLAIYSDTGSEENPSDRSMMLTEEDEWQTFVELNNEWHFNFGISVLIDYVLSFSPPITLKPDPVPTTPVMLPAWPNPFNSTTRIQVNVPLGVPFTASLFEPNGRLIRTLGSGIGSGWTSLELQGLNLPAGVYTLMLNAGGELTGTRVVFLK